MEEAFYELGTWLEASGAWAYLLAPLVMAAVAVLPIPAEFPAVLNGMLFGPVVGTLITYVGAMAGAQVSFELARMLGRPAAERIVPRAALAKCDRIVLSAGRSGLLIPRLLPIVAFTAMNWCAGLTPVTRWRFFWTTAIGIVPGVVVFTTTGAGLAAFLAEYPYLAGGILALVVLYVAVRVWLGYRRHTTVV